MVTYENVVEIIRDPVNVRKGKDFYLTLSQKKLSFT